MLGFICAIGAIGALIFILYVCAAFHDLRECRKEIERLKKEILKRNQMLSWEMGEIDAIEIADSVKKFRSKYAPFGAKDLEIPPEVWFAPDEFPGMGEVTEQQIYGDFTVYCAPYGECYHCKQGCSGALVRDNLFHTIGRKRPCFKCVPRELVFWEYPKWYRGIVDMKKNVRNTLDPQMFGPHYYE